MELLAASLALSSIDYVLILGEWGNTEGSVDMKPFLFVSNKLMGICLCCALLRPGEDDLNDVVMRAGMGWEGSLRSKRWRW
jgi:hypothetical protein